MKKRILLVNCLEIRYIIIIIIQLILHSLDYLSLQQ